jgi:manganese efflux pump family protein
MSLFLILGLSLGLAMDAFAVATAASVSLGGVSGRQVFRFAFHFGLFQAMMPILGWLAGRSVASYISSWDHWLAFGLLVGIGGKAIVQAIRADGEEAKAGDPTRGVSLVLLSVATSVDALAVGLSFAVVRVNIWVPAAVIGLITAGLTSLGMLIGSRLGSRFGKRMEIVGGVVLVGIGVKILLSHLA